MHLCSYLGRPEAALQLDLETGSLYSRIVEALGFRGGNNRNLFPLQKTQENPVRLRKIDTTLNISSRNLTCHNPPNPANYI